MAMIIRGGMLITMTQQGSFVGDVLLHDGQILRVDERIEDDEGAEVELDAHGLHIMPAMVDASIGSFGADPAWLRQSALACGVTSGLITPYKNGKCTLLDSGKIRDSSFQMIDMQRSGNTASSETIRSIASAGLRPVIRASDEGSLVGLLSHLQEAGAILVNPPCAAHAVALKHAGINVVTGGSAAEDFSDAAALLRAGVPMAISCCSPRMKLRLLPVLAGLYVRNGMQRKDALSSITRIPAEMLGLSDRGKIAPGYRADLLIFDGDPLLLASVHLATIIGGRILRRA